MDGDKLEAITTHETVHSETMKAEKLQHVSTLGSVRLQNVHTKEIILVPEPSNDPNDPLNWYLTQYSGSMRNVTNFQQVERVQILPSHHRLPRHGDVQFSGRWTDRSHRPNHH